MKRFYFFVLLLVLVLPLLSGCNLSGQSTQDTSAFLTQAAATVIAAQMATAAAASPTPSQTPPPLDTPIPTQTNTPLITATFTPTGPTRTPLTLNTPAAQQPAACDNAAFVADVNYPDFSNIPGGTTFIKTWRLKNLGPCTWTTSYKVVFSYMSDTGKGIISPPGPVNLPKTVKPGEEVDVSVTLTAPTKPEGYRLVFRLQNDKGFFFGPEFWVLFRVPEP
ncbi:MAG: NBR1-Ig-like domain-containing protein [Anaerolineales bacterium]|nr:NBR1-Ig-like domain-containing protein [Anaerolineales bacterium]MCX7608900.1 NBR1-Ig-like domain-containing protein [Anaerolineales bacterium]MDW8227627.1 NBR1-Ig-like domain-containing protein [Anaerolineales bacterium]